eukprot:jgi/Mesvir1/25599/Mv01827-RA.1
MASSTALALVGVSTEQFKEVFAQGKLVSKQQFDGKLPLPSKDDVEADQVRILRDLTAKSAGQIVPFIPEKVVSGRRLFHLLNFLRFILEKWTTNIPSSFVDFVHQSGGTILKVEKTAYACPVVLANLARAVSCPVGSGKSVARS